MTQPQSNLKLYLPIRRVEIETAIEGDELIENYVAF